MKKRRAPHQVLPKVTQVTAPLRQAWRTGNRHVRRRLLHACKTVRTKRLIISCEGVDDPVSSVVFFSAVPNIGKFHGPRAEA